MNRIGSLVFAAGSTALTGFAVVSAAGGSIFGLHTITQSVTGVSSTPEWEAPLLRVAQREAVVANGAGTAPCTGGRTGGPGRIARLLEWRGDRSAPSDHAGSAG